MIHIRTLAYIIMAIYVVWLWWDDVPVQGESKMPEKWWKEIISNREKGKRRK